MAAKWSKDKMERWVTIYTDAGWKEGRARCGFIARGSVDPVWLTGSGGAMCDGVPAAEALAVLHALRKVGEQFAHPEGLEGFFIRSDNTQVVNTLQTQIKSAQARKRKLQGLSPSLQGDFRRAVRAIFDLCREREWTMLVKHVKAHGREPDRIRRWMNDRADRLGNMRGRDPITGALL